VDTFEFDKMKKEKIHRRVGAVNNSSRP